MKFLEKDWELIQKDAEVEVVDRVSLDAVASGYIKPWNHDMANMNMICNAISELKPKKVIELGTFEGLGTKRMADTMEKNNIPSLLWTFDEGKISLEPWPKEVHEDMMNDWQKVVVARNERISFPYQQVVIEYVEGLTVDTLPQKLNEIGEWDFCFQDSVHNFEDILMEWESLYPHSHIGSVIAFDDMFPSHEFLQWFPANVKDWEWRYIELGRSQLWAERIR